MKDISERYRIRFELGSGRLGKVYLAKDLDSGRNVALKLFSAEALEDPENFRSLDQSVCVLIRYYQKRHQIIARFPNVDHAG